MRAWIAKLGAALFGVVAALAVAEIGLRVAGFHFQLAPSVQFGWPDPVTLAERYHGDPGLMWVTKDYSVSLDLGRRVHPAVIFMGDSCTEWGKYPTRTIEQLKSQGVAVDGLKVGVGGWSSEQGRVQAVRDVVPLHPRVITVYYGWNDHWIALGPTDPDLMRMHRWLWWSDRLRILQMVLKARVGAATRLQGDARPNRVSEARYIDNLETITRTARAAGIVTVLITAPTSHVAGHEPPYLRERHVRSLDELVPLHRAYVDATRRAAHDAGALLCDAYAAFDALPQPHDRYFLNDGIHLTDLGDRQMAAVLAPCIANALSSSTQRVSP
jgi:lysophospholipase L1-like esterase